ncbi:DUF6543 domain-containing protein [Pseudomonas sp. Marseille-Q1929]|uniref:dermonecrotic toxin domain-containing protein n=1 Tax=Pseudomonas sp. Marseille-Q1929 TaxID=2730402 RepID=UPI001A902F83|nr:DUF6543 domain-containing protein [Pseudomonas sp. Marseille-Q1929]MBO0492841.1 hypothetical protein [Pseudomonas sp. Marseille-Q1929]
MSTSLETLKELKQAQTSRDELSNVFAFRLTLTQVAQSMIQEWISEWFAGSHLQSSRMWVGVIQITKTSSVSYKPSILLSDALIKRCMSGVALDFSSVYHQLLVNSAPDVFEPVIEAITVDDIEWMLNTLAPHLLDGFCTRLVAYWNDRVPGNFSLSRWRAVSNELRACLLTARQNPALTPAEGRLLLGLGEGPQALWAYKDDRQALGASNALSIYQVYAAQDGHPGEWLPLLVLQRQVEQQQVTLVYVPVMNVLKLGTLDALGNLLPRYMSHYIPGLPLKWVVREPQGDVFDALAQTLLERQLRNLQRVNWLTLPDIASYERLFIKLTSPLAWFEPGYLQHPHEEQLPVWLQTAGSEDRHTYGQWLIRLMRLQETTAGASFMDGLDSIHVYARKALQRQMRLDYPREVIIDPDDYLLTFERTQGATVGWTQYSSQSLTLWALQNPFATAYASVRISNLAEPGHVPDWWLKPAYLKQLIEKVDVGKHYPALLEEALLSNTTESGRRRRLFVDQMAIQLPMQALEYSLRGRNGVTRLGASMVQAVLESDPLNRRFGGELIVARALAILTHAGGVAHKARNLFVIGPRDNSALPCILYRPDEVEAVFQQFPHRQALLNEIARTGSDLQELVLERLPEDSRILFRNGGFLMPHVQRVLQGDEHSELSPSSPALLSDEPLPGMLLEAVFDANAMHLVQTAKKQSTSNEELRWALFKNDLWQLFNAVLPMLKGTVAVAGWLAQAFGSFRAVLALSPRASQKESLDALVELIGSVAGLLMSPVVSLDERLRLTEAKLVIGGWLGTDEISPVSHFRQTPVAFAWQRTLADVTSVDFSWANARLRLDPTQKAQLETLQWLPGPGEKWPVNPRIASTNSPVRGRVLVQRGGGNGNYEDYTLIASKLYGVKPDDGRWRIVDLRDTKRLGPWLKQNSRGVWNVDLGMQLHGGQTRGRPSKRREEIQRRNLEHASRYNEATKQLTGVDDVMRALRETYNEVHSADQHAFSEQNRHDSRVGYLTALEKKRRLQFAKLDALIAKNANQPITGFMKERLLQVVDIVESLREEMAVLMVGRKAQLLSVERRSQLLNQLDHESPSVAQAAHDTFLETSGKLIEHNEKLIELSLLERSHYAWLASVPGYTAGTDALTPSTLGTPLDWRSQQLRELKGVMLKRPPLAGDYEGFFQITSLIDEAITSVESQKTLQEPGLLSVQQRIDGYEAILQEYGNTQAALREYRDMNADLVYELSLERFNQGIDRLENEAQASLVTLLREREVRTAPKRRQRLGAGKRLIQDRKHRYWVGQERARTSGASEDIVDVVDPIDKTVVASFRQSPASDEFEAIAENRVAIEHPARPLEKLKEDARKLLAREPIVLEQTRQEALTSSDPASVERRLTKQSDAIKKVAKKIRDVLPGPLDEPSQRLLNNLAQASERSLSHGRSLRIKMVKRLPPDEDAITYLKSQNEVKIWRIDNRVPLKRPNDFLQEYVIEDNSKRVLAYAHFHYSTPTGLDATYDAGHLKLPKQRFMSFRSLADKADSDVIKIYYSRIGASKAQQLFFSEKGSVARRGAQVFW